MMRNTVLLLFSVVFLLLGCTPPAAPLLVYTKYENEDAVPRIKVEEAKREADAGNVIFVDSRPEAAFKAEHLPGAVSIPLGADAAAKFSELPKGKKIIVYCTWPHEHTSASLAFQMNQKEIPATYALEGGPPAWKAAGYQLEKSE